MKRILLTSALALALTGSMALVAQQPAQQPAQQTQPTPPQDAPVAGAPAYHRHGHHHANPQRQAAMLAKRLNLTQDQEAKLEPIFASRDQQFRALVQDQSLTPQQRHQQMRSIHQSTEQQLAGVLTPDQLQQMKAMRHNHRRFNGPNGPSGQAQPDQQAPPPGL
ncbi:MAG TPA: hypothetical protein VHY48_11275 [Acidobacteriaceae bacterium]|jgi:Spy/CpxP family protein refolding chaperone|nr:hypothetical protein [Acidobacteriaceae bacterium]